MVRAIYTKFWQSNIVMLLLLLNYIISTVNRAYAVKIIRLATLSQVFSGQILTPEEQ